MTDDSLPMLPDDSLIGGVLAAARVARGLSVEDVAAATRIRTRLVTEIEHDRFDSCGGAIYARGHIRSIAQVVGADADELVARFDRDHGNPTARLEPGALPRLTAPTDRDVAHTGRTSPRWASAAIAVLAVGAVFLGVSWWLGGGNSRVDTVASPGPVATSDATSPTPATPTSTSADPTSGSTGTAPVPSATSSAVSGVQVQVRVLRDRSWMQVRSADGEVIFASTMEAGQIMRWHDEVGLTLRFGNAPVLQVNVNGQDLGTPCTRTVCTVRYPHLAAAG